MQHYTTLQDVYHNSLRHTVSFEEYRSPLVRLPSFPVVAADDDDDRLEEGCVDEPPPEPLRIYQA